MEDIRDVVINLIEHDAKKMHEAFDYLRVGQCMFNILYERYPKVADEIRGSKFDPFYQDSRIEEFKNKVKEIL